MQAVTVISTSSSGKFNIASTVVLAGLLVGKNFAYSSLYGARSSRLVRCVNTVTTLSREVPAVSKIILMRSMAYRVCSRTSLPTSPLINQAANITWAFKGYAPSPFDYYVTNVTGMTRDVGAGEFV